MCGELATASILLLSFILWIVRMPQGTLLPAYVRSPELGPFNEGKMKRFHPSGLILSSCFPFSVFLGNTNNSIILLEYIYIKT